MVVLSKSINMNIAAIGTSKGLQFKMAIVSVHFPCAWHSNFHKSMSSAVISKLAIILIKNLGFLKYL
jgi:predicted choloylglycine hydrolase